MNNISNRNPENFGSEAVNNNLWQYIKSLNPETLAQLSKPTSPEILQAIERTVVSMLGNLPSEDFDIEITTSREHLGMLLASAMMNGYFLHNVQQRLQFEKSLQ
ncbi:DUF760 domain-containing protein [Hassallia byssoidea VB512170]|uniref:DUF760 domain-containing protein n=1 Tax=Hassallia byssoidea VB512170 TaxID=1304833 RepID=A0A846HEY5_9CYAN|nr:DUF760 domain-containing protein [Hassalia byssoidea]NEU75905.1 DUF760 domain-containing protein [Hassalia byssoidea VB512170]